MHAKAAARWVALATLALLACQPSSESASAPGAQLRQAMSMPITSQPLLGQGQGDLFGHAIAVGDLNGDGMADLVVSAPNEDNGVGVVRIYQGPIDTLGTLNVVTTTSYGGLGGFFGSALAIGDFNGDGVKDLAVSAPGYSGGYVYLFLGPGDGGWPMTSSRAFHSMIATTVGASLLVVPRPGVDMLWFGAPALDGGFPLVGHYAPALDGGLGSYGETIVSDPGSDNRSAGVSLALVSLDGGNQLTVAVGAPLQDGGIGGVHFFDSITTASLPPAIGPFLVDFEHFGAAMTVMEPQHRLIIGAPMLSGAQPETGGVWAALAPGVQPLQLLTADQTAGTPHFGEALTTWVTGGYNPELVVGSPGISIVTMFAGTSALFPVDATTPPNGTPDGSRFGCALEGHGDLSGDMIPDLVVGAETLNGTGGVFIIDGTSGTGTGGGAQTGSGGGVGTVSPDSGTTTGAGGGGGATGGGRANGGGNATGTGGGTTTGAGGGADITSLDAGQVGISVNDTSPEVGKELDFAPIDPSHSGVVFRWDFGDLSMPVVAPGRQSHAYKFPGGFQAQLRVNFPDGGVAMNKRTIRVRDALGRLPPSIRISASGTGTLYSFYVAIDADAGLESLKWDTGAGEVVEQPFGFSLSFPSGQVHVHAWAHDNQNLWATDSVTLEIPEMGSNAAAVSTDCQLVLESFLTPEGTGVSHDTFPNAVATELDTDQVIAHNVTLPTTLAYDAGIHPVGLTVRAGPKGCVDRARVIAYVPPRFTSTPPPVACGEALTYVPTVVGDGPLTYRVAPTGLPGAAFDPMTGAFSWPHATVPVTIQVQSWAGTSTQTLTVEGPCAAGDGGEETDGGFEPGDGGELVLITQPCRCSSGDASALVLLCGLMLRRRRR